MGKLLPSVLCSHANECPNFCECGPRCYCYPMCHRGGRHVPGRPRPAVRCTVREGRFYAEVYPGGVATVGDDDERLGVAMADLPVLRRLLAKVERATKAKGAKRK